MNLFKVINLKIEKFDSPVSCECCGSPTTSESATKRGYSLRKCLNCGLIFVWPQPSLEELNFIYSRSQGYFGTAVTNLAETTVEPALCLHELLKRYNVGTGRLLDIGCATGKLIFHMQNLGYTVAGCDINAEAVNIAVNNGLEAQVGTIEMVNFSQESFDIIYMGDVLEHVPSPMQVLKSAYRLLKPNGVIVIITPNAKSSFSTSTLLLSRITGFPWAHSEAPYHLFEFTHKSIQDLLKNTGFSPEETFTSGKAHFLYAVGGTGFFDDLKRNLKSSGRYQINTSILPYIPKLIAVSILLFPFYLFSRIADSIRHSGQSMTVIAHKPI